MIYKTALPLFALLSAAACVDAAPEPKTAVNNAATVSVKPVAPPQRASSIDGFGANLDSVIRTQAGNFVYSPASIAMALSMTREGARGNTAAAMDRVLSPEAVKESKALVSKLSAVSPQANVPLSEVHVANRIFADGRTIFEPSFSNVTKTDWLAPAETVDFGKDPEAGRLRINGWVAHETHDKIANLLAPGTVDQETRMVLVNAIYMKAQWLSPFTAADTKPQAFFTSASASKQAPMMHGRVRGAMGEHDNATVFSMPYASFGNGPQLSMLVVVPKDKNGIDAVEDAYDREGAEPFAKAMTDHGHIDVRFPKFKVTASLQLSDALTQLGMGPAFSDRADFSGMSTQTPLKISKVVHQAFAEVDEKGTEAAAATAVIMEPTAVVMPSKPLAVTVDRPFLFFVRDDATGAILFTGRITDPTV
jgi:serpin B